MGNKVKLGELLSILTDYHANGAYKKLKENVELLDEPDFAVMIRTTNFEQEDFTNNLKYINKHAYSFLAKSKVYPNDIIMNKIANAGSSYLMPDLKVPVSLAMNLFLLRVDAAKANPIYIYLYLRVNEAYVKSFANGSVTKTITKDAVRNLEIELPSRSIQDRIAEQFICINNKITLNRQINQTLEQMAQTLFKSWFVDFDPVVDNALDAGFFEQDLGFSEELLHRVEVRKAVRESDNFKPLSEDIRRLFPDAFEECAESALGLGGWIPEGWEINCLENISKCIKGTSYKSSELSASDTALVTLKSFQRGGGYRLDGLKSYVGSYKKEQEVFAGDLIIACTDVTQAADIIGKPAIVISDPCYSKLVVSLDVAVIRPKHISLKYYLYGIAKTLEFQNYTYSHSTGTTVLHLSKNAVPNFMVSLPNELILQRYHEMVLPLFDSIEKNTCSLRVLTKLRDTLLPKLISGELSLSDIKIDIPEETLI
ncbi:hypothetical protein CLH65_05975 [Proteus mirabilis]|uniref:restriction endonuclease subunit S n=1 Tax=Proteus mirabilis TaxID=584 RepID=UPI000D74B000|nr:restriction endonuclease subunit S [Proteus mirabilis]AWR58924.1 hypothetical protein CLH65_05975 [Proteus mirabilis]